jgi:hypothetical protein
VNRLIATFVDPASAGARAARLARAAPRRSASLYVSSPIGLGHARATSPSRARCATS